ncbi:MAG: hypothetical protein WCW31_05985 [Patescibacteria group bacterium]|jgi:hypothetical protein
MNSIVSETAKVIAEGLASGALENVSEKDLADLLLNKPSGFPAQLANAIKNLAGDEEYSTRVSNKLYQIADMVYKKPEPRPEDFPPELMKMPELNGLSTEELQELHGSVTQCIQDLHERWSELSYRADPGQDPVIFAIFTQLRELEYVRLPNIENALAARRDAVERAA